MRFLDFLFNYSFVLAFTCAALVILDGPISWMTPVITLLVVMFWRSVVTDTRTIFEVFDQYKKNKVNDLNKNPLDK